MFNWISLDWFRFSGVKLSESTSDWYHLFLGKSSLAYCLSVRWTHIINSIYKNYKKNFIPFIGDKIAKNKKAYKYLEESIDLFPNQKTLLNAIQKVGFIQTKYVNLFN